jgi:hypothetical protein
MAHSETTAQPKVLLNIDFLVLLYESTETVNKISQRLFGYGRLREPVELGAKPKVLGGRGIPRPFPFQQYGQSALRSKASPIV